ncbi:hypothetical protein ACGFWI_15535 [Streptomyces sp. NPDC048434]|uniref:hypothetical protein n=1 Tax=Streptomyces sp. NPDC048434 TaxID=3365549 RepID=UPI0037207D4D
MRKFARSAAVAGAGFALAAVLSPVAHAAGQAQAPEAQGKIWVHAHEHAQTYKEATTHSPKAGSGIRKGESAPVICLSTTGWYKIADAGPSPIWAEAQHFESVVHMPKC